MTITGFYMSKSSYNKPKQTKSSPKSVCKSLKNLQKNKDIMLLSFNPFLLISEAIAYLDNNLDSTVDNAAQNVFKTIGNIIPKIDSHSGVGRIFNTANVKYSGDNLGKFAFIVGGLLAIQLFNTFYIDIKGELPGFVKSTEFIILIILFVNAMRFIQSI